jgi:hypothetical protein
MGTKYLPKAERVFQKKLQALLAPTGYLHNLGGSFDVLGDEGEIAIRHWRPEFYDAEAVAELFEHYGHYLILIEEPDDVSEQADA